MVYLSEALVGQIKQAESVERVKLIIDKSLSNIKTRSKNGSIEKKYTHNILMALKYYKAKELEAKPNDNLSIAIEIFKKIHAEGKENLW